jgi:hypothetical protein
VFKRQYVDCLVISILFFANYASGFIPPISFDSSVCQVYCSGVRAIFLQGMNYTVKNQVPGSTIYFTAATIYEGDVLSFLVEANQTKGFVLSGSYVDANSQIRPLSTEVLSDWRVLPGIPYDRFAPNTWTYPSTSSCSWPSVVPGNALPSIYLPTFKPVWSDLYYNTTGIRATVGTPNAACGATIRTSGVRNMSIYINGLAVGTVTNPFALYSIFQPLNYGDVIAVMLHYDILQSGNNGFAAWVDTEFGRWDTSNTSLWRATIAHSDWSSGSSTTWANPDLPEACNWTIPSMATRVIYAPYARSYLNLTYITVPLAVPGHDVIFRTVIGVGEGNANCQNQVCSVSTVDCCY